MYRVPLPNPARALRGSGQTEVPALLGGFLGGADFLPAAGALAEL